MLDDEWVTTGPHQFVDCWCGHRETSPLTGKTLDIKLDRVHRWQTLACDPNCALQSRIHGHVHIHCPECAALARDAVTCC
jgi:hypothetical protein